MRKFLTSKNIYHFLMVFILVVLFSVPFALSFIVSSPEKKAVFQSKAFSCGTGVPAAAPEGVEGLQNKINSAKDGEIINLDAGTYSGATALPLGLGGSIIVSDARGAADFCMIRIEGKTITLKGQGIGSSVIYGEGHARPYQDPYQHRAGICIINSNVTLDNLRVKEFQKRCVVVYNSAITVKNSVIEGCDEGGVSLLGESSGLLVNNYFVSHNFGGVMLWQNSQAKIINNIFDRASIAFFYHPKTDDKAKAEIINNLIGGGGVITQVAWWPEEAAKLTGNNTLSHNLIWNPQQQCNQALDYCGEFPGKIEADPQYTEPVTDACGIAAWSNFTFKEGSPAIGAGDPNIPGLKNLGVSGGPCADPSSSICSSFIQSNKPAIQASSPTPVSVEPTAAVVIEPTIEQEQYGINPTSKPTLPVSGGGEPVPTSSLPARVITQKYLSRETSLVPTTETQKTPIFLIFENKSKSNQITLKGITVGDGLEKTNTDLSPGQSSQYEIINCEAGESKQGGILYESSEDNMLKYKNIEIDCEKQVRVGIE